MNLNNNMFTIDNADIVEDLLLESPTFRKYFISKFFEKQESFEDRLRNTLSKFDGKIPRIKELREMTRDGGGGAELRDYCTRFMNKERPEYGAFPSEGAILNLLASKLIVEHLFP